MKQQTDSHQPGYSGVNKEETQSATKVISADGNAVEQKSTVMDELIEMRELLPLLGYKQTRSARRWLRKNKINMVPLGKNTYVSATDVSAFIAKHEVSTDNISDTKDTAIESAVECATESSIGKSKASLTLLKNINAAN